MARRRLSFSIPGGYVLGRLGQGRGRPQLIPIAPDRGINPNPGNPDTGGGGGGGGGAAANIQTLLDGISSTQGHILYRSAASWVSLAPGTVGQALLTNGAGANPAWGTAGAGTYLPLAGGTMTGQLVTAAGSEAAPSLGVGATDTGIYRNAASQIGFTFAGTRTARFTVSTWELSRAGSVAGIIEGETSISYTYGGYGAAPNIDVRRAAGTRALPTVITANTTIGQWRFLGYDGAVYRNVTSINTIVIAATPSSTDMESRLFFNVTAAGSGAASELVRFDHATGFSMYGANVVIDLNRIYRMRNIATASLPAAGTKGRGPVWDTTLDDPIVDNGTAWVKLIRDDKAPFDVGFFYFGSPPVNTKLWGFVATRPFQLPDQYADSQGYCDTAPAATITFDVRKNNVSIGSMIFTSANVATFTNVAAGVDSFVAGDRLEVFSPASMSTLTNLHATFKGTRTG